jgi:hypothetical protein
MWRVMDMEPTCEDILLAANGARHFRRPLESSLLGRAKLGGSDDKVTLFGNPKQPNKPVFF